jgi:hypothetical protein
MKHGMIIMVVFSLGLMMGGKSSAQKGPIETAINGCNKELKTYCKDVTPGEGRILACLYARSDKLSGRCEYALYDAAAQLERAVTALTYVANECRNDLQKYCANIPSGQGRLVACLEKNNAKISSRCKQSLKDVGLNNR